MRTSGWLAALLLLLPAATLGEEKGPAENGGGNPPFHVAGSVVDEDGQPVAAAIVEALYNGQKTKTRADDAGRFALDLAQKPWSSLILRAEQPAGPGQACAAFVLDEASRSHLERFLPHVHLGLPDDVKLVVRPPRTIEAVVVDGNKQSVADARLIVQATWYDKIAEAKSDANGKALLLVPADAPLSSIVAIKGNVGLDYFLYQNFAEQKPDRYRILRDNDKPLTFVLNGARPITVKVVDGDGRPLPGATISSWSLEKPRKGRELKATDNHFDGGALHSGIADLSVTSNADGLATFDFWPADCVGGASIHGYAAGYRHHENAMVPASGGDMDVTFALDRIIELSVQMTRADGRPAAGAWVFVYQEAIDDGKEAGPRGAQSYSTAADERGRLRLTVFPKHFLLLMTLRNQWAAPLTTCLIQDKAPKPLEIVLEKATRVHGRLTAGPDKRRIANQRIGVSQHVEDAYRQLEARGLALKARARGGRAAPASDVKLLGHTSLTTNAEGEFEVFLGPGKYQLAYGQETKLDIEIAGEAELEVNLHAERPAHVDLVGRVVFEGQDQKGVADARLTGYYLPKTGFDRWIEGTADAKGAFRLARRPVDMLVYARDEYGLFAQLARVGADDQATIITLGKAASLHGRLIEAATGEPVGSARVAYGIPWDGPTTSQECGGSVQTDEHGDFTIAGLVPGKRYRITLFQKNRPSDPIATVTPSGADRIELGEYRANFSGQATRSASGLVAPKDAPPIFHSDDDADTLIAAAQQQAKAENKRVLLVFGADWSAWCHRLRAVFQQDDAVAAALRESFVIALVDVEKLREDDGKNNLARRFAWAQSRLPFLVTIDASSNFISSQSVDHLEADDHFDVAKLLDFLSQAKRGPAMPLRARPFGRRRPAKPAMP